MNSPFFYIHSGTVTESSFVLNEETSKHIIQVLRMQNGEQIQLTDGEGHLWVARILDNNRKKCRVEIIHHTRSERMPTQLVMAVSPLKNTNRFEWFLEKATELGVTGIIPLICERTEKKAMKADRLKTIMISAMLQSKQCWLPDLQLPVPYDLFVTSNTLNEYPKKFIAHCHPGLKMEPSDLIKEMVNQNSPSFKFLIAIGPEGDFSIEETELAINHQFIPLSLGRNRLRTETAAVLGASFLIFNQGN